MTAVLLWNMQKIVAIWQKITAMQIFHKSLIVRKKIINEITHRWHIFETKIDTSYWRL